MYAPVPDTVTAVVPAPRASGDSGGRHRARTADRGSAGSRRIIAAVVAVVAVSGGGGLLLDYQTRPVALPEQPIPDPVAFPEPAVQPPSAQPPNARPPNAQPPNAQPPNAQPPNAQPQGAEPLSARPRSGPPLSARSSGTGPTRAGGSGSRTSESPARPSRSSERAAGRSAAPASPARTAPGRGEPSSIDLAAWRLTLPTRGDKGGAALVDPTADVGPWLNRAGNGAFTFWAPTKGATTANSKHARTELVGRQHWAAGEAAHTLRASVAVTQTPSSRNIILGQIHGAGDMKSVPFVMLHYKAGTIEVVVKKGRSGDAADRFTLLTGVPLNSRFGFTIADAGNGTMTFSATRGAESRRVSAPVPEAFRGATVRFQAGAYQLGESGEGSSDEGGRVTFYGLSTNGNGP